MAVVYRVQIKQYGLYRAHHNIRIRRKLDNLIRDMHNSHVVERHPSFDCDFPTEYWNDSVNHEQYNFAFKHIDQLKIWFDGWLEELLKFKEVNIVECEVSSFKEGHSKTQVIYDCNDLISKKIIKIEKL